MNQADLSKRSFAEAKAEMARIAQEERQRRLQRDQQELAKIGNPRPVDPTEAQQPSMQINISWRRTCSRMDRIRADRQSGRTFRVSKSAAWHRRNTEAIKQCPTPASMLPNNALLNGCAALSRKHRSVAAVQRPCWHYDFQRTGRTNTDRTDAARAANAALTTNASHGSTDSTGLGCTDAQRPPNNVQQANEMSSASQMATQLGMSAGPGNMFPIVPTSGSNGTNSPDRVATSDHRVARGIPTAAQFSRFTELVGKCERVTSNGRFKQLRTERQFSGNRASISCKQLGNPVDEYCQLAR